MHSPLEKAVNFGTQLDILYEICQCISGSSSLDEFFNKIYELLGRVMPTEVFYVGLYQEGTGNLDLVFIMDENKRYPRALAQLETETAAAQAIFKKETILLNRTENEINSIDPEIVKTFGNEEKISKSIIAAPILIGDKVQGVISTQSYDWNAYNSDDAKLFTVIATCSSVVLGNLERERLQSIIELASSVSHEFNQPLTGITGYCNLIKEDLDEQSPLFEDIVEIGKQAVRLEELVRKFQKVVHVNKQEYSNQNYP
jgi:transcriptional regulator with GAF, ATPase, and Fis domain